MQLRFTSLAVTSSWWDSHPQEDAHAGRTKEMTETMVTVLGKKPEHTHIVIQEIAEEDWGFAGMLTDDWKKTQPP